VSTFDPVTCALLCSVLSFHPGSNPDGQWRKNAHYWNPGDASLDMDLSEEAA